jgi:DNA integrity scanning protein DisA with diadenylate cyclase activity
MSSSEAGSKKHGPSSIENNTLSMEQINGTMIRHARQIAEDIGAHGLIVYVDIVKNRENLKSLCQDPRCLLAARGKETLEELSPLQKGQARILQLPDLKLNRPSQIKVAATIALSQGLIQRDNVLVFLTGSPKYGVFDNIVVVDLDREIEMFSFGNIDITDQITQPAVFERLLTIALELAEEGKEGKPIGTVFVLGDHEKVMSMSSQMIINPFAGVPENERNILDPAIKETIREFSALDGAFIIRDDGVILAAGRHLAPSVETSELPQGLGARHRCAAGITALTKAIAIVISESTGDIRIFSRGKLFMEIQKAKRQSV